MEAIGSLGVPVPRPQPVFQKPRPIPRIAEGLLEAVLIEVTRPLRGSFSVRIFDKDFIPPEADVVAAFVLYGAEVAELGRRLELAWDALDLHATPGVRYACYRTYDHTRAHGAVLKTVEALQESFLP
ncbi:MAG: hypothetical protein HY293_00600 [Planctomycetes bacterium]|nr:hypothetical protein [Planctomycetota bacterium]